MTEKQQDDTVKGRIIGLLQKGYTRGQLINDFSFAERTVDIDTLIEAASRMHHLERAFVGKCGLTRQDDRVSKAYYGRLRPGGKPLPEIGVTEAELEKMKDDYYRLMGWDLETGMPTRETLEKCGLADMADGMGL